MSCVRRDQVRYRDTQEFDEEQMEYRHAAHRHEQRDQPRLSGEDLEPQRKQYQTGDLESISGSSAIRSGVCGVNLA